MLRYHVSGKIAWEEWYFVLNKSFAWTAFTLIGLTVLKPTTLDKLKLKRRELGLSGYFIAVIHLGSILFLFNEEHFPIFYTENSINLHGIISLSAGAISLLLFTFPLLASLNNLPNSSHFYKFGKYGVAISILHPALIGFQGWFKPLDWPLYMPPITLLVFFCGISFFLIRKFKS